MAYYQAIPWHEGEDKIHKLTRVPHRDNPTHPMLAYSSAIRVTASPTIALGTIDNDDNIWCTVWGGDLPIAQQVAKGGIIGIKAAVDATYDPVVEVLYGGKDDGEVIKCEEGNQKMVSGLSIHLEERDRVKLFGRMVAGCLDAAELSEATTESVSKEEGDDTKPSKGNNKTGTAQLVLHITQSLGNCPKYLNKKTIKSHPQSRPQLVSEGPQLSPEAISHVHSCDIFFVASRGVDDMDCNHRGGMPGFLRVQSTTSSSSEDSTTPSTLIWPEYSGNNLYQTLGNIVHNPKIGLCIPNFATGDVLYVTGKAQVLLDREATAVISKTKLAVQLTLTNSRFVKQGLLFRGEPCTDNKDVSSSTPVISREIRDGMSPYNPRVRYLTSELDPANPTTAFGDILPPDEYRRSATGSSAQLLAKLTRRVHLTPTVTRYTFQLASSDPRANGAQQARALWKPGQYVALDFSDELYMGYSHMADNEPTSINDDFIRTFTVASRYVTTDKGGDGRLPTFEMVIRNVGHVTRWLSRQNDKAGITEVKVVGFGGELTWEEEGGNETDGTGETTASINDLTTHQSDKDTTASQTTTKNVFIAAGIGITPLLGHLSLVPDDTDMRDLSLAVLWTLHVRDMGLAGDVLPRLPASLRKRTKIYITGTQGGNASEQDMNVLKELQESFRDVVIERRRLGREDVLGVEKGDGKVEKWFVCTAPVMRKEVQEWLGGRTILFENFDY